MTKANVSQLVKAGPTAKAARRAAARQGKLMAALNAATLAIPKGTFAAMGGAAGGALYGPPGAAVGTLVGRGVSYITGRGDYKVRANSIAREGLALDEVPTFSHGDNNTVRIRHREFVKDFVVPSEPATFHNEIHKLNPGNSALFPWLNTVAKQYQQYKPLGMVVEFVSRSSDYAASGPLGTIGIATNYNVNDLPYATHSQFENSEFAVSCKPSRSILHAIECAPHRGRDEFLYVRDTAMEDPSAVSDSRFSDIGSLQIMSVGLPSAPGLVLGQIWITYDIEFVKPIVSPAAPVEPLAPLTAFTSNPNGTSTGGSTAGTVVSVYRKPTFNPAGATAYSVVSPNSMTWVSGLPLTNPVFGSYTATSLKFEKVGTYEVAFHCLADSSNTRNLLSDSTAAAFGSGYDAYLSYSVPSVAALEQYGYTACTCCQTVLTGGYNSTRYLKLTVSSVAGGGVTLFLPKYLTATETSLVQNLATTMTISWTAKAETLGQPFSTN